MGRQSRRLERRRPVRGLERCPGCHPERSEGSLRPSSQTLSAAKGDRHSLRESAKARLLYLEHGKTLFSSVLPGNVCLHHRWLRFEQSGPHLGTRNLQA
jgi:hypothetical protein